MSHLIIIFFNLIPASGRYIGEISKSALILVKLYFSIGKLWATIEILIYAQLSIKSIFSNTIGIGYWQNFTFGYVLCSILHLVLCQMGNFPYFPPLFGILAIKAMAFHEISPFTSVWCNNLSFMYGQMGNFYYFSFCLTHWL